MTATERHITGHLRWLEDGQILASWRLSPLQRPRNTREADIVGRHHRELWRAIAGHRFWLESLLIWTDPAEIAHAMLSGVDLAQNPAWAETTDAAIDVLNPLGLGRRRHVLTVKLNLSPSMLLRSSALATANDCFERLSMSVLPPDEKLLRYACEQARGIERALPAVFAARRMSAAEVIWSRRHAWQRDGADLVDPAEMPELAEELLEGAGGLGRIHLDPHGLSEAGALSKAAAVRSRRWIAVSDDRGATSYQAGMVIADVPRTMAWPDTEFLGRIDDAGVPVDLTVTGQVRGSAEALRKAQQAMKQLGDQTQQITAEDGDPNAQAGHQVRLSDATQIAVDYTADLTRDRSLVEIEPVMLVSVAADSPEQADAMAQAFLDADVNRELRIVRPLGQEKAMFWARQPGGVPSSELNGYRQLSHSAGGLGQSALVTAPILGDQTGIPISINQGSSLQSLVYLEPFGRGAEFKQKSPSMATAGDQGGGKTQFAKTFAGHMVDRGARLIATDTSDEGEWVTFTRSLGRSLEVVDFFTPRCSIDPLRTLPPKLAGVVTQSFLATLLDLDATGPQGRTLAKVLRPAYLQQHSLSSLGELVQHLGRMKAAKAAESDIDAKVAREIAERVGVFSDPDTAGGIARVIFDPSLPPLDLGAQCQIWRMNAVQLPDSRELDNPRLFEQMSIEKRMGRAVYALYARHANEVCMADPRPALQNVDEFAHMLSSREAMLANETFLRRGRHTLSFWHAQSQLPEDFAQLGDLVRTRLVLRMSSESSALDGAAFLGKAAPEDPSKEKPEDAAERFALAAQILEHNADGKGLGMMRDHRGNIGPIWTLEPFTEERTAAASTSMQDGDEQPEGLRDVIAGLRLASHAAASGRKISEVISALQAAAGITPGGSVAAVDEQAEAVPA